MPETKAPEVKAPDVAVVDRAQAKFAADAELNRREQAALEAQEQIDNDRGYRRILLHPAQGIYVWQHIATQHTTPDGEGGEQEMRRWVGEYRMNQIRG